MTKAEAIAFLKKIGYKQRRKLEGVERTHMLTLFSLLEPAEVSNNQHTWTETYYHAGKEYELTWGFEGEDDPYVEEIIDIKDDIQQD
jgi:hypothetical protein